MTKVEIMRAALKELGEASTEEFSAFLEKNYKLKIEPKFIPILRASARDKEMLEKFRQTVKSITDTAEVA